MFEVEVEKVIWRGRGLGRLSSGKVVIILGGVFPREKVKVDIIREKKDYIEAILIDICDPHPARRDHPCPNNLKCGGCRWGSVWEWFQISLKKELLYQELKRNIRNFSYPPHKIGLFVSPSFWHYRYRAQIHILDGTAYFKALNTNSLVELKKCFLLNDVINKSLGKLAKRLFNGRFTIAMSPDSGEVFSEKDYNLIKLPISRFDTYILTYPCSFFQANWDLNQNLVRYIVKQVGDARRVADLYAGAGNFSIPLAKIKNVEIIAFELDPFSIKSASIACEQQGISNIKFIKKNISKGSIIKLLKKFSPDVVIIDPPRVGCGKNIIQLNQLPSLKKMIWISCDVVNTIRDIKPFLNSGWGIKDICIFDMFPQTWHMEVVLILERDDDF